MFDDDCGRHAETRQLRGQERLHAAWRARLHGRVFVMREELDPSSIGAELAHVSILAREPGSLRFRLAGSALRQMFGREARGLRVDEVEACAQASAWMDATHQAMNRRDAVSGCTRLADGRVHFWLRLPMSSDGVHADMVLCHDRYLTLDALADPDMAARAADLALRLDAVEMQAA